VRDSAAGFDLDQALNGHDLGLTCMKDAGEAGEWAILN
jgi:hypothetical protein